MVYASRYRESSKQSLCKIYYGLNFRNLSPCGGGSFFILIFLNLQEHEKIRKHGVVEVDP